METKYEKLRAAHITAFVDSECHKAYVAERERAFLMELKKQMRN
jgi:hypothetical protein